MNKSHKLSIGISDFEKLREREYYYVDKTLLIREILEKSPEVILLPRPRRFGKTLNLSMLRYFFEKTQSSNAHLFQGLSIEAHPEIMAYQGQYPVICMSFKDVRTSDFSTCIRQIHSIISKEYGIHQSLSLTHLTDMEQEQCQNIFKGNATLSTLMNSLSLLMSSLHHTFNKKVIVLIDEYDAPIHAGYQYGYYDEIVLFMRNFLSSAFKDNPDIEKGILTGILRIAKESIFSGLNNVGVYTLLRPEFQDKFGFTQTEVSKMLEDFSVNDKKNVSEWYNGYLFGNTVIYNPWSVISYIDSEDRQFRPYWINTSSNDLIKELICENNSSVQSCVETLINQGTIRTALDDNIVLRDIRKTPQTMWSLLTFSGYLKIVNQYQDGLHIIFELAVPNQEVQFFYEDTVKQWLSVQIGDLRLRYLLRSLIQNDIKTFGKILEEIVVSVLSFHDAAGNEPERVYHAFVLGLLINLNNRYIIRSNRESGYGRYDVILMPKNIKNTGFVFEFKKIDKTDEKTWENAMKSALCQIQEKAYAQELKAAGIKNIQGIGVVVHGKQVWVEGVAL